MPTTKTIVCLANSRKNLARCVAGIELIDDEPANWVRPVSNRDDQAVSEGERCYIDGGEPQLLDIIDISLLEHRPKNHQQENWLIDASYRWNKVGKYEYDKLHILSENSDKLWRNGDTSKKDSILSGWAAKETNSLKLIHVSELLLNVFIDYGTIRISAKFEISNLEYNLRVTDPNIERQYKEQGRYQLDACYLTISLGEPYTPMRSYDKRERCYKLVAAVIEKP